jgi:pSer/pThr/pTyr-binding forkhead associated (FHA) protein
MKISVLVKSGADQRTETVNQPHCVVGRQDCDVVIEDKLCSRNHAIFYEGRGGKLKVKDLGSANGTLLKGKKVQDDFIDIGDEIRIGATIIKILSYDSTEGSDEGDSVTYVGQ